MNLEFWGVKYDDESFEWIKLDRYALLQSAPLLTIGASLVTIIHLL